jgi:hypothetical protein
MEIENEKLTATHGMKKFFCEDKWCRFTIDSAKFQKISQDMSKINVKKLSVFTNLARMVSNQMRVKLKEKPLYYHYAYHPTQGHMTQHNNQHRRE